MDKTKALQKLLNGTATEEDITLLKRLLASGEISIGGNVNQSVIIIGSGNTVELPPAALDRLNARPMLGNLDRDLTGEEITSGLRRLDKLLPNRAPILIAQFKAAATRLRPTLKTEVKALSENSRRERLEALAAINSICIEAVDISFNALGLGEEVPKYDARSPFRGLESFRPEDGEFFFGREELTRKLAKKIQSHNFLAVLGASGSGKSSLVMAGLIPALNMDYVVFRPGINPLEELDGVRENTLLVVDQFEEAFTLTRDEEIRRKFISRLLNLTKGNKVVITLRSDFLGEVAAFRDLNEEVQSHLENVPPMNMDEMRHAMEGQVGVVGLRFEADLSQQILEDVEGEPGAMPLLQHALWELWNRRHGRNLRANEYRAFGGVKKAITSTAEAVHGDCTKAEQEQMREVFLRLTRLDDSDKGRDTPARVEMSHMIPAGQGADLITLLDKLANARLIVKTVNEDKTEIEVAHEALIRHWERLQGWLNEDRDGLRLRESMSDDARKWEGANRNKTFLNHHGNRLKNALALSARYQLTDNEQQYLNACMVKDRKNRNAKIVFVMLFVMVLTVLMLFTIRFFDHSPSKIEVNGSVLEIWNQERYRFFHVDVGSPIMSRSEPFELHPGEGKVIVVGTDYTGSRPGQVIAYDMNGREMWDFNADENLYDNGRLPGHFTVNKIVLDDFLGTGNTQIIFKAMMSPWYPNRIGILDLHGNLISDYWNAGSITDFIIDDLNGDGVQEMIVNGLNNSLGNLMSPGYYADVVFVLDPNSFPGQSYPNVIEKNPFNTELWSAVFFPAISPSDGTHIKISTVVDDAHVSRKFVVVQYDPGAGFLYFSSAGEIIKSLKGDAWQIEHPNRSPEDFVCFLLYDIYSPEPVISRSVIMNQPCLWLKQ